MVVRVIICLAVICAALDYHRSQAVRCLKATFGTPTECEGKLCTALYYVHSEYGGAWTYDCVVDELAPDVCEYPNVRYEANYTLGSDMIFKYLFKGCCSSDWCSNDTEALTMPPEYEDYLNPLNPSSPVEPFPSSSRLELEIGSMTSISPPEPPISIILLPSVNQGVPGTTGTMVSQSRGVDGATSVSDVATSTDKVATSRSKAAMSTCIVTSVSTDILTSTVLVQPSGQPSSSPSGDMDYATLSFMLIILVCFLVCVIIIMFVAMGIWWATYYRKMQSLGTKFTEFKLQIE